MKKVVFTEYTVKIKKRLPGGRFTCAFLSDFHNALDREETDLALNGLRSFSPEFVLCGGDMIVARPDRKTDRAVRFLKKLASAFPVVFSEGNHEYRARLYPEKYPGMYSGFQEAVQAMNIRWLHNENEPLCVHKVPLRIYGFDLDRKYYNRHEKHILPAEEIRRKLGDPSDKELTILLAHNPAQMDAYLEWGADLTLCGHYHGGLMRLGGHRGLVSPGLKIFPAEAYGHYFRGGKQCIVTSGCGEHTIPVRIFNPREIVILHIWSE